MTEQLTQTRIFTEIPLTHKLEQKIGHTVHRVAFPERCTKGWYVAVISLSAFAHGGRGKRRAPCWAPDRLYYLQQSEETWLKQQERYAADPILAKLDERLRPTIEHASLWDFYRAVGWDWKRRRWVKP